MCSVERSDRISFGDTFGSSRKYTEYLRQFFDLDQLYLIEQAFEVWNNSEAITMGIADRDRAAGEAALRFGMKYKTVLNRMKAIMQNIVDNKGTFQP